MHVTEIHITLTLITQLDGRGPDSLSYDLRHHCRRRRISTPLRAYHAIDDDHSDSRQIPALNAFQHSLSRRMLSPVDHNEGCGATRFDRSAVQVSDSCGIPR